MHLKVKFGQNKSRATRAYNSKKEGAIYGATHYFEFRLDSGKYHFDQTGLAARLSEIWDGVFWTDAVVMNQGPNFAPTFMNMYEKLGHLYPGKVMAYRDMICPEHKNILEERRNRIGDISLELIESSYKRVSPAPNKICYYFHDDKPTSHATMAMMISYLSLQYPDHKVLIDIDYGQRMLEHLQGLHKKGEVSELKVLASERYFNYVLDKIAIAQYISYNQARAFMQEKYLPCEEAYVNELD